MFTNVINPPKASSPELKQPLIAQDSLWGCKQKVANMFILLDVKKKLKFSKVHQNTAAFNGSDN